MKAIKSFLAILLILDLIIIWYITEFLPIEDVMVDHDIFYEVPPFNQILNQPVIEDSVQLYSVMQGNTNLGNYSNLQLAIENALTKSRTIVVDKETGFWVHNTFEPYIIISGTQILDFKDFNLAYNYAIKNKKNRIYYNGNEKIIWERNFDSVNEIYLNIPHIKQMPELPRGCEVTSLAMILNHNGVYVDKMKLAEQVKKDVTKFQRLEDNTVFFGNPKDGFVGDMYSFKTNGLGVYHEPIYELANSYLGYKVIDLTGLNFEILLQFIARGYPIWVISNSDFKELSNKDFEIWNTPTGVVKITYKMHSVVMTGFNDKFIYINDPLANFANKKTNLIDFKKAWEQMGSQAIVILE
ncbi:MAG: hypothetical protein ATN31_04240 [Candidatus Epulonipiscioides saccharophilum]|nr:MAG: hypothetical protein ATN31_04240 [Epulopiscium sp. AS2M-Bin001]